MNHRWGVLEKAVIHRAGYLGSFFAAIGILAYIAVWLLVVGVIVGVFALIGVCALLVLGVWLPCFLLRKASPKTKS
jgi:uncharacterized membrane protein